MASNEKQNLAESLGGNDLAYRPFTMTSGWSMTLKMEPKLTVFWRDKPTMPVYRLQMASNEKPNMSV